MDGPEEATREKAWPWPRFCHGKSNEDKDNEFSEVSSIHQLLKLPLERTTVHGAVSQPSWKTQYSSTPGTFGLGGSGLRCLMKSWTLKALYTWSMRILNGVGSASFLRLLMRFEDDLLAASIARLGVFFGETRLYLLFLQFIPYFGERLEETRVMSLIWMYFLTRVRMSLILVTSCFTKCL